MADKKVKREKTESLKMSDSKKKATGNAVEKTSSETPKRLYRSKKNAMIAGVAAGLAEYFTVDPAVVRLIFVLTTFFSGFGIPVYIILWIILPENESGAIGAPDTVRANTADLRNKAEVLAEGLRGSASELRTRTLIGYILIGLGIMFVLQNFGFFRADIFWPLFLVIIGLLILRS